MWIWWFVSLVILIACIIFAYRMIMSSFEFLPADRKFYPGFKKNFLIQNPAAAHQDVIRNLRNKLQSIEDTSFYYEIQFSKFQQRLTALEEVYPVPHRRINHQPEKDNDENWKELYYEENGAKEKLENALDGALQKLDTAGIKIENSEENHSPWVSLQIAHNKRLNKLQSKENRIQLLQKQLEAVTLRENDLKQALLSQSTIKDKYTQLECGHLMLQKETEDLKRQVAAMNKKERELIARITIMNERESLRFTGKNK